MLFSIIDSQTYNQGKIGAIVEVIFKCDGNNSNNMERPELLLFINEILFQIAAVTPKYLNATSIPKDIIENKISTFSKNIEGPYFLYNNRTKKAEQHIKGDISRRIKFMLNEFYEESCLLSQNWIKDRRKTIKNLIVETSLSLGMDITISQFERYEIRKEIEVKKHIFNVPWKI